MIINCVLFLSLVYLVDNDVWADKFVIKRQPPKFDNPNFIRDRHHDVIWKPMMDEAWVNRFKKPFGPSMMDFCDPYHCNDYNKIACGLNRQNKRYKWFQSGCHIKLNNLCSTIRGNLEYEMVDTKYCYAYVMNLREGCPTECPEIIDSVCAVSLVDNHIAMFKNRCVLQRENCKRALEEYEEIFPEICLQIIEK